VAMNGLHAVIMCFQSTNRYDILVHFLCALKIILARKITSKPGYSTGWLKGLHLLCMESKQWQVRYRR